MGTLARLAVAALTAIALEGCAGPDVMDYSQTPMPREIGHAPQEAGRMHVDAGSRLHERLHDDRGD